MASKEEEARLTELSTKLDKFLAEFATANINRKANDIGKDLIKFLTSNPDAISSYGEVAQFTEGLGAHWVANQNSKVSQYGLEALIIIAESMQQKYKNYSGAVLQHALTKLGDSKETLREKARAYLLKTIEVGAYNASNLLERLATLLNNKNKDMSLEAQKAILEVLLMTKGKTKITASVLNELTKAETACLATHLREDAAVILIDVAERVGKSKVLEALEKDIHGASGHHQKKIQTLIEEIRNLKIEQSTSLGAPDDEDDTDFAVPKPKRPPTATGAKAKQLRSSSGMSSKSGTLSRAGSVRTSKLGEGKEYALHSGPSGEADEAWFLSAFEDVPEVVCMNHREFDNLTKKIVEDLKSGAEFWEKKVVALQKLRSMVLNLTGYDDEIQAFIKNLAITLMNTLKDLRSQVVRETCLTFAFICKELKNKVDAHTCEIIMVQLMNNVMSSAKVISTASYIALKFMFMYMTHTRLISTLVQTLNTSKSREVRTAACEFLELIMIQWPTQRLEQQIPNLQEGIKKGTAESSTEARMASRRAYLVFAEHFPEQGEALLNSMDVMSKKQLMEEMRKQAKTPLRHEKQEPKPKTLVSSYRPPSLRPATSSSAASSNVMGSSAGSAGKSVEDLSWEGETPSTPRRSSSSAIPVLKRTFIADPISARRYSPVTSVRSNSAIDLQAVQRAKARQQYAALARQKVGSGASLPRPGARRQETPPTPSGPVSGTFGAERTGRTRSRVAGVSHSQPSSRSGSPSSRLGYHTYQMPETNSLVYQTRRTVPRSQGTSRETSPNRFGSKSSLTNLFGSKPRSALSRERPPIQPSRPVMAHKLLQQSLEAEDRSLFDGDDSIGHKVSPRKASYRPFEDHSDDSDASSLCSERSFDSYRRTSDSFSWSGSQQRLYRDVWESGVKDIEQIVAQCESIHWNDRKEGLVGLQSYLQAGNLMNASELKRITDVFTRMFMDSHTKVFSLFLDTLNEVVIAHHADLNSWLYVLLTRLLNKLGADLLGSIQNKILKSLDIVREHFPPELQMSSVLRFLTDPTQTPNLRVKTAALNFISKLALITDPSQAFPPPSPGQSRDSVQAALHKMIGWTMGDSIKQGTELRRAAQEAIMALFNLNTPQVTLRLANLPQEYQEAAASLLKTRVRRGSAGNNGGMCINSPPSPAPHSAPSPLRHPPSRTADSDLNPEEIYRSLRKTTAEIQNYTYETGTEKPPDKDNTTSKDSGISQLSGTEALEEAMEELSIQSSSSSNATTTTLTNRVLTVRDCNGMDTTDNAQQDDVPVDEHEAMRKIVEALKSPPDSDNGENISIVSDSEKRASLGQLTRLIRESSVTVLQENFKALLRILLGNLALESSSRDIQTRILVLTALTELIKKRAMTEYFNHYVELLILKVLNSYKDTSKEVVRSAEACANTIATTLSPGMVIRVLAPLIQTGEYPLNLAAVKMLTRLVEVCGRDPVYNYLPDLMPGLIQAYDNQESSVRKSAVFCMVSLHTAIGEEDLKPHLAALNGSKLKLLHLYIRRSQQGSSAPTSPRNHPPPPPSS